MCWVFRAHLWTPSSSIHAEHSQLSGPGAIWACSLLWSSWYLMLQPTELLSKYRPSQTEKAASKLLEGALCSFQDRAVIFGLSSTSVYLLRYLSETDFTSCTWQPKHTDVYQRVLRFVLILYSKYPQSEKTKGCFLAPGNLLWLNFLFLDEWLMCYILLMIHQIV